MNHGIVSVERARPATWRQRLEHRVWRRDGFIHRYVFPDGTLVPFREVVGAAEAAGFETRDVESLREHYALTLRAWVARLTARSEHAIALVGERRYRTWKLYMTASAQAFSSGAINIVQTLLAKPDRGRSALPLTRDDILLPAWAPTA
jgi:cyclopropane-fatty-acyl-phospholipid synthase